MLNSSAINLLPMVQILSFPPHCPQQSRENYSINCLAVAGAAWQGGTALVCQTRDINFCLRAEPFGLCAVRQGSACMHVTAADHSHDSCWGSRKGVPIAPCRLQWPRQQPCQGGTRSPWLALKWGVPPLGAHIQHGQSCALLIWALGFTRSAMV